MENHYSLTDKEFIMQFQRCNIDPDFFSHEAHLRLAWIHITYYGLDTAIQKITQQLRCFVEKIGAAHKYNETVTIASVKVVNHFMLKSFVNNFKDFIDENPRLKNNFKGLLAKHYVTDIFNSPAARREFLNPELIAFD